MVIAPTDGAAIDATSVTVEFKTSNIKLVPTSASGAKFQFTPIAASSAAVIAAAVRTLCAGSGVAARAICPGRIVAPLPMRLTAPPSWSISKNSGRVFASLAIRVRSAISFVRLAASVKFSE